MPQMFGQRSRIDDPSLAEIAAQLQRAGYDDQIIENLLAFSEASHSTTPQDTMGSPLVNPLVPPSEGVSMVPQRAGGRCA